MIIPGIFLWAGGCFGTFAETWILADDLTSEWGGYGRAESFWLGCAFMAGGYGLAVFGRLIEKIGWKRPPRPWILKMTKGFLMHPLALVNFFTGVAAYRAHQRMSDQADQWTIAFALAVIPFLGFLIWCLKGARGPWDPKVPVRVLGMVAAAILAEGFFGSTREQGGNYAIGLLLLSAVIFVVFFVKKLIVNRRPEAKESRTDPRTTD